jgi:putative SOS response-associated peptidase YedK
MCGRFTLRTPTPVLVKQFELSVGPTLEPRFNIAPTQDAPVIRHDPKRHRELSLLRWGLVPSWAKDIRMGARMINARSETAADKPAFRSAFKRRRCLILTDGYFEWSAEGKKKQPHWIRRQDESAFAMAGLWERWQNPETDSPIETCTILTTDSNDLTSHLHERMPVILEPKHYEMWLDTEFQDRKFLEPLLVPFPSDQMKVDRVSPHVNNARNEGAACVEIQRELF